MYDVASPESFEGLDVWLNELDTYATKKTLIKMLVANKIDKVSLSRNSAYNMNTPTFLPPLSQFPLLAPPPSPPLVLCRVIERSTDLMDFSSHVETQCYSSKQGFTIIIDVFRLRLYTSLIFQKSAKTRDGVQEAFEELVHKVLQTPELYVVDSTGSSQNVIPGSTPGNTGTEQSWCGCSLA